MSERHVMVVDPVRRRPQLISAFERWLCQSPMRHLMLASTYTSPISTHCGLWKAAPGGVSRGAAGAAGAVRTGVQGRPVGDGGRVDGVGPLFMLLEAAVLNANRPRRVGTKHPRVSLRFTLG